jgi:RNA polymerase sigma-70 factor (ECF subfamily)
VTNLTDDAALLAGVRRQDAAAWQALIDRYQGRLLAFVEQRLQDRSAAEDVVQETFLGFLISLVNYDSRTPLEAFLFSIAAHKLTDALRRRGVRPRLFASFSTEESAPDPVGRERKASSLAQSMERRIAREVVLQRCLQEWIAQWLSRGEYERLKCVELLLVVGLTNQEAAGRLGISEQAVANHKAFIVQKLKDAATAARLRDVDWTSLEKA